MMQLSFPPLCNISPGQAQNEGEWNQEQNYADGAWSVADAEQGWYIATRGKGKTFCKIGNNCCADVNCHKMKLKNSFEEIAPELDVNDEEFPETTDESRNKEECDSRNGKLRMRRPR